MPELTLSLEWDASTIDVDPRGAWDPTWSTPVFSLAERDRRWGRVRKLMARDGLDAVVCLPDTGRFNRGNADAMYLTQLGENQELVTAVFPMDGDVVAWQSRPGMWPTSSWGIDIRRAEGRGMGAAMIIGRLKELGLGSGRIGVAGLTSTMLAYVRQAEGLANWQSVEEIKRAFPDAEVVSATPALGEARYQKSEEEIEFIRKGVRVSELLIEAVREHGGPGMPERLLYAHMQFTAAAAGGSFPVMLGWTSGPLGNIYHRLEQPSFRTQQPGDVLSIEIEGRWGGYVGRTDQSFTVGSAHPDYVDSMHLTFESFNRVAAAMRPGVRVEELIEAGHVEGMGGRGVANLTMHGYGTGDEGPLVTGSRDPELLNTEIREGCTLLIKPGNQIDRKPGSGNWGDTVVVRANGAERLGARPQEVLELH